jgi:BatD DUF11 like domain
MRRMHRAITAVVCVVLLLLAGSARAADEPKIVVEAGATEIFSGESVDYVVEIRNVENPTPPDLKALRKDFDVVANGDESRNQSSTFIINGRVSREQILGHVFRFRLTPKRTGKVEIPGPSAMIDGKTISGRALTLNVVAPAPQDLVVGEIKTDRQKLYPTQPFEVTLRVLVRPLPDDPDLDPLGPLRRRPPHLEVNWVDPAPGLSAGDRSRWLEKLVSDDGSGFTLNDVTTRSGLFFDGPRAAVFSLYRGRETRNGLDGRPINYFVYELTRKFTAEKSGRYVFGPGIIKGSFVEASEGTQYTGRRLVAVVSAATLEVREVPTPRPATYCGGIGDYRLAASASPTSVRVGDPLTLSLTIERGQAAGSLDLISAPDLAANPQLAADFEIVDKSPTGRREGDVKRFDYALRPKRAGVGIPAVAVTVFDPDRERFSDVASNPIALSVSAGSRLGAGDLVGSLAGSGASAIKSRAQGIYQNITDLSEVRDQRVNVVALAATAAGAWCVAGCLIVALSSVRRKSGDLVGRRKRQARRAANRKLADARKALAEGRSMEAIRAIRSALVGLIADMRDIVAEGLTASDVDASLASTVVPAEERAAVRRLLEAIESAEYGSGASSEPPAMLETAERLIPSLARHLQRSS